MPRQAPDSIRLNIETPLVLIDLWKISTENSMNENLMNEDSMKEDSVNGDSMNKDSMVSAKK